MTSDEKLSISAEQLNAAKKELIAEGLISEGDDVTAYLSRVKRAGAKVKAQGGDIINIVYHG